MARIILEDVSVDLPIYDARGRSLKRTMLRHVGGRVSFDTGRVNVQALRNVSFSLKDGDRLAVVGHNGAGKTTLLRVISGIYEPFVGRVTVEGSLSSMTDFTMGMDPDATGRENIRLRCVFLGMSFEQIDAVIDEICAFSGLEEYLELPIRTYSSGMLVRLGFAASTAYIPEILVMDEMIGAGDLAFADKARERIDSYLGGARILVLASHSIGILQQFCNKGLLLERGHVKAMGPLDEVLDAYHRSVADAAPAAG